MDGNDAQVQLPARHASKASKNRYRVLLDQIEGGFYVAEVIRDDAGKAVDLRHLAVNDDFERVTGLRDVAGRLSSEVVPNLEDYWLDLHDRVDRTAAPAHMENYNAYTNRWYRVSLSRAGNGDGCVVGVIDDVTERKRREFHAAFLDELNDEVMDLYTPAEIIERVSQRVGEYLLLSRCMVVDVDNRGEVTVSHGWTREDVPILRRRFLLGEYLGDEVTDALRHGETVLIADTGEDERAHARSYADLGIGSVIAVPLHRHGHWTGVLVATASEPRDWPTDEVDLMGEVALRISPRLERARGDEALRISEEKSRTLFDSIDEGFCILEMIFDEAGAPVDYRYVETNAAFQRQTGLSDAVGKRMRELAPDTEERLFEILGRVARTREPMRFETASRTLGRYFEAYAFRIGALEEGQVALLFRDITERKRRESNATF